MQTYADYLFLIALPDHIGYELGRYKRASVKLIGHYESMNSKGHISICKQHRCKPFLVEPALKKMEARINTMPPIELQASGFDFFSHGKVSFTIYAKVETGLKVNNWFKLLFNQMQIKQSNFSPHITIVRNIPGSSFRKLWPNFEKLKPDFLLKADHITVLQRPAYIEHQDWQECKKMYFENKIGKASQPDTYLL